MDDNWNPRNNQDDRKWDRWDSNASNSSYYNQPVHKPYGQAFSYASFLIGMFSVTRGCCGFSLPFGALGLLFALLVYRRGKKLNHTAKSGLVLSCIGIFLGLFAIYITFVMPQILQRLQPQNSSDATYGTEYNNYLDYINRYYDYLMNRYGIPMEE